MFDELDDPAGAPRGDLARVLARAADRRRHRRAVAGVGSGVALSLLAGVLALARPGTSGPGSLRPLDPAPSTAAPTVSGDPTPSGSATPQPGESPPPEDRASATPTPSPTPDGFAGWDQPDGKPGWSTGFTWCTPASDEASRAPATDLRLTAVLDQPAFRPGDRVSGTATIHNDGDRTVTIDASAPGGFDGLLFDADGTRVNDVYGTDAVAGMHEDIPAGGTYRYRFAAATSTCGDTSDQDETVPAGDYTVAAVLFWNHPDGPYDVAWVGERVPVTLDPAAPPPTQDPDPLAPCWDDGSGCAPLPASATCETTDLPGGDYGTGRDLTLTVAVDDTSVRSGDPVIATATITNSGTETAELTVVDGIDGGVLLDSTGAVATGRRQQSSGTTPLSVAPGAHVTVTVTVQTRACTGDEYGAGVPPGQYDLRAGVYVDGYGWWVASGTPSVLVTP